MNNRYDITHNLENIVYNELIYMGYEVYVYKDNGKEIDFWGYRKKIENMIQGIFSVKNSKDKKQKIVTVFGKKIYINR